MKVAVVGCGVMGSAIARQIARQGETLMLLDHKEEVAKALVEEVGGEYVTSTVGAEVVILAVKPKDFKELAKDLDIRGGMLIISILTGISVADLQEHFPGNPVIRTMPNLPLVCGQGVTALVEDKTLDDKTREVAIRLFSEMGEIIWVKEEEISAITALAGSGPAFILGVIEAMVDAGVSMGLKAEVALWLAMQTAEGTITLLEETKEHPAALRWKISSPGGTTIAGLNAFAEAKVRSGIIKTLLASYERAREMGER